MDGLPQPECCRAHTSQGVIALFGNQARRSHAIDWKGQTDSGCCGSAYLVFQFLIVKRAVALIAGDL
jgi:hypothetical protein